MMDVFISKSDYADMDMGLSVCEKLENAGISCWISPRDVDKGRDFEASILSGIRESRMYVLILSNAAMRSEHVTRELKTVVAWNNRVKRESRPELLKPILVYEPEKCRRTDTFEYNLQGAPTIEAWRRGSGEAGLNVLVEDVRRILGRTIPKVPEQYPLTGSVPEKTSRAEKVTVLLISALLTALFGSLLAEFAAAILPGALTESDLSMVVFLAAAWFPARAVAGRVLRWLRNYLKN